MGKESGTWQPFLTVASSSNEAQLGLLLVVVVNLLGSQFSL